MSTPAPAITFSHVEQSLLRKLRARRGDVAIRVLFCAAFGVDYRDAPTLSRNMQQRLGPYISDLNQKLEQTGGERVVTGLMKRTYRLAPAGAWEMIPGPLKPTYRFIPAKDRKTSAAAE